LLRVLFLEEKAVIQLLGEEVLEVEVRVEAVEELTLVVIMPLEELEETHLNRTQPQRLAHKFLLLILLT
jgi:hypothetical protein